MRLKELIEKLTNSLERCGDVEIWVEEEDTISIEERVSFKKGDKKYIAINFTYNSTTSEERSEE